MGRPSRGATLAEVHHAAVIVGRGSRLNDRSTRPGNRACVPFDRLSAFHWDIRYVFERDHLHDDLSSFLSGIEDIRNPVSPHAFGSATGNLSRPVVTVGASGIHVATGVQGAAMPQRTKFGSSLPWRPVIDPAERLAHKQGAVAVREVVGDAKRLATLLVGQ